MRLWHQKLIPYLDSKRLLGQHRECCALRGKGWGKKHRIVDYVFTYDLGHLYQYHLAVIHELVHRNVEVGPEWYSRVYRGRNLPASTLCEAGSYVSVGNDIIYPEHNDSYLRECLLNLKAKGAELVNGKTIDEMLVELDLNGI